jgi:hypothetical protein
VGGSPDPPTRPTGEISLPARCVLRRPTGTGLVRVVSCAKLLSRVASRGDSVTKPSGKMTSWLAIGALCFSSIASCCFCASRAVCCCASRSVVAEQDSGGCCARKAAPDRERNRPEVTDESNQVPAKVCSCAKSSRAVTAAVGQHLDYFSETDTRFPATCGPGLKIRTLSCCLTSRVALTPQARGPPCATGLSG